MFKIQLFSRPQKKKKQQQELHHHKERGWRSFLLLRVCVHPPLHFTHQQQLLQYTALIPRAHGIETEVALRDHGNCKLFLCCSSLSLSRSLSTAFFFFFFRQINQPHVLGCGECMADELDLDLCGRQMKGTRISNIRRQGKQA
jgi:hypothetical protein